MIQNETVLPRRISRLSPREPPGAVSPSSQRLDAHDVTGICSKSASEKRAHSKQSGLNRIRCHDLGTGFFFLTLTMKYDCKSCGLIIQLKKPMLDDWAHFCGSSDEHGLQDSTAAHRGEG